MRNGLMLGAVLLAVAVVSQAEIVGVELWGWNPPTELGGYELTAFPPDPRWTDVYPYKTVDYVPGPTGDIEFDRPLSHRRLGHGWLGFWGHSYTPGDVYFTPWPELTLGLPPRTGAFVLYAQADGAMAEITVTANDGTSVSQWSHWSDDAVGFGFYTDGTSDLTSVAVSAYDSGGYPSGYAVGQFLIAPIPEPATVGLLGLGVPAVMRRR